MDNSPLTDPQLTEAMRQMANVVVDEKERRLIAATILGPLLASLENRYTAHVAAGHTVAPGQIATDIDTTTRTALRLADNLIEKSKESKIKV